MKKKLIIGLVLILLLSLVLHSCKDLSYSGAMGINYNNISVVDYESALILDLLNNSKWTNGITNCGHDYTFTFDDRSLRYHSECGTFIDIENNRALALTESDKTKVNALLAKLFGDIDPSWE